ncbi:hypothetical protein H072_2548 [Dactylellina haptotyla CBS 200.50]|uniref:Spo7-like protein n=1 Tax=Dactylellina haptotyla (strain CBS 200.50) TaxID=1284197 RepID=S8AKI5_DACHA|nr:hypothetical protein H072_2548 [Dactylellina haptotyla CBS 200.50]
MASFETQPSELPPSNVGTGQESRLDQIIKGTPAANSKATQVATAYVQTPSIHIPHDDTNPPQSSSSQSNVPAVPQNPLDSHPTSPPTIYLNLIILEASLRAQYQRLHLRRRKYTVFLLLLCLWTGYFFNAVYIVGPSPYSIISTFQKLCLIGGIVTGLLFWMSGLYAKTMIWPRRLVGNVNKGLRMFNVKLVVVNRSFSQRMRDWLEIVAKRHPLGWIYSVGLKRVPPVRHILHPTRPRGQSNASLRAGSTGLRSSPVATPGTPPPRSAADVALAQRALGNVRPPPPTPDAFDPDDYLESGQSVKLVILAKHFSADFREGWEIYRSEYWEKENERRAVEVAAIQTSILETGELPPMNSHGVVIGAGVSHLPPTGAAFPGISGRPVRKPSISSGSTTTTRARARSNASNTSSEPGQPPKPRVRIARRRSSNSLRQHMSIEDLDSEKASMDVKLKRRSLTRAPGTDSSTSTLPGNESAGSGL